jgi:geranylgeranyl pyrophosphate synthase
MRQQVAGYQPDIRAALDLLILAGGKRLRPRMTMLVARMLGADSEISLTIATAIEMLHTATLVHDDLIDGSLLRRGCPTLNAHWSPGATILTGDFLFARAANLAAETNSVPIMRIFAQTLTTIVNGELVQLFSTDQAIDRENYFGRIYAKTAALFEMCAIAPALSCDTDPEVMDRLRQFGYSIGIAFQIVDDILDFSGQQATLGKPIGNDLRQGIITLPAILFFEKHPDDPQVQNFRMDHGMKASCNAQSLIEAICASDAIAQSYNMADEYVQKGIEALTFLPDLPERLILEELAAYITSRQV